MSVVVDDIELRINYSGNNAARGLATLTTTLRELSQSLSRTTQALNGLRESIDGANTRVRNTTRTVRKASRSVISLSSAFKKMGKSAKQSNTFLAKLGRSLGRIAFYRGVRSIIKGISDGFKTGVKDIVLYSKALGGIDSAHANETMSRIATSSLYLKNSLGAVAMPILQSLVPAIQTLCNWLVKGINLINQFISALQGKSVYTKAKEYWVDYAAGLDKASGSAKKLKSNLLGIDELNVISPDDDGSGGGGANQDYSQMFEEAQIELPNWLQNLKDLFENGDYEELGRAIANLITNALQSIDWDYIKSKASNLGKGFAEFFNGFIDPTMFHEVGRTIAECLNTAIEFSYSFVTTFDWENAGLSGSELVDGFVENFDASKFGSTVYETIKGGLDMATTFFDNVDFEEVGQKIMDFLSAINWDQLVVDFGELGLSILNAVKDTIKGAFTNDDGSIDLDAIKVAIDSISVITSGVVLTNMIKNALPVLGTIGIKAAIVITVAKLGFEGGLSLGQLMSKFGIIPKDDSYWYETFSFDGFFESLTSDFETTFSGIIDLLTDFENNPVIAILGDAIAGPFVTVGAKIAEFISNFEEYKAKFLMLVDKVKDGWDSLSIAIFDTSQEISGWFDKLGENISDWKDGVVDYFDDLWTNITDGWDEFWTNFGDSVYDFFNGLYKGVENLVNGIIDIINSFSFDIPEVEIAGQTFGGGSIGFDIAHVSFGDLPRLFANGGFPEQGQLFIANEAGPELVGGWGNQTAVANNNQIIDGIQSGVASAVNMTLAPYLSQIANNTGVTANKDFSVRIGDRDIARANVRGQRSMGRTLIATV